MYHELIVMYRLFVWLFAVANVTSAVGLPAYLAIYYQGPETMSLNTKQTHRLRRERAWLPRTVGASVLAVLLGFTFPAWMSLDPYHHGLGGQAHWISVFVLFPILTTFAEAGFQTAYRRFQDSSHTARNVPHLQGIILILALGSCRLYFLAFPGFVSNAKRLIASSDYWGLEDSFIEKMVTFMQADWIFTGLTALYYGFVTLAEAYPGKRIQIAVGICISAAMLGPGATVGLVWGLGDWWMQTLYKED